MRWGTLSPRPYQPGQACDGSITTPALALFIDFCAAKALDAAQMLCDAYPDENDWNAGELNNIRTFADWQGVAYPCWNQQSYAAMLDSLTEVNYHSLRGRIEVSCGGSEAQDTRS